MTYWNADREVRLFIRAETEAEAAEIARKATAALAGACRVSGVLSTSVVTLGGGSVTPYDDSEDS